MIEEASREKGQNYPGIIDVHYNFMESTRVAKKTGKKENKGENASLTV